MFLGFSLLDLLLIVLLLSYAVTGYRQGLVVSVLSLAGFLSGGAHRHVAAADRHRRVGRPCRARRCCVPSC